jgi:hypothetical protein
MGTVPSLQQSDKASFHGGEIPQYCGVAVQIQYLQGVCWYCKVEYLVETAEAMVLVPNSSTDRASIALPACKHEQNYACSKLLQFRGSASSCKLHA